MGISFSNTTRRRNPTHPYPPPLHPHPMLEYYPPYPPPYSAYSPSSPPVYYTYYNSNSNSNSSSNSYTVCNHANAFVSQPYFPPFGLQPVLPHPRVAPPSGEQKAAKVVNSDVNVHKDTFRLEIDELNSDQYLVSFVFDALVDGSITICYFAKEETDGRFVSLFPETYIPIKVPFRKGLHQEFRQPLGTGIDLRCFSLEHLSNPSSRDDVFPIVITADTCPTPYNTFDDRSDLFSHNTYPQMQITQVAVLKSCDGLFTAKVIRQLLWSDDICYELRDIYGLGKSGSGFDDGGSGKECVICLTEPKDVALLPCRHMCMCSNCAKALRLQSNKCPICREIIDSVLEIMVDNMESPESLS